MPCPLTLEKGTYRGLLLLIHVMLRNNILSNGDRNDVVPFRSGRFTKASSDGVLQACVFRLGHVFPDAGRSDLPSCPAPAVIRSAPRLFRRPLPAERLRFSCSSCLFPCSFTTGSCRKATLQTEFFPLPYLYTGRGNRLSPAPSLPSSLIRKQNSSLFLLFSLTYFKTSRIKRKNWTAHQYCADGMSG